MTPCEAARRTEGDFGVGDARGERDTEVEERGKKDRPKRGTGAGTTTKEGMARKATAKGAREG